MKVKFYYPNSDNNGSLVNPDIIKDFKIRLVTLTGGATEYKAKGYYINETGKLIEEYTDILESITTEAVKDKILDIAQGFKTAASQESVMLELDEEVLFI